MEEPRNEEMEKMEKEYAIAVNHLNELKKEQDIIERGKCDMMIEYDNITSSIAKLSVTIKNMKNSKQKLKSRRTIILDNDRHIRNSTEFLNYKSESLADPVIMSREEIELRMKRLTEKQKYLAKYLKAIDNHSVQTKKNLLDEFKAKMSYIDRSIQLPSKGIDEAQLLVEKCNEEAFRVVNRKFSNYFQMMVPGKKGQLEKIGDKLEKGIQFVISNSGNSDGNRQEISQLSGGQRTLLSLAFVFALASYTVLFYG